ncbi:low molecular weight protein arginine phosphatase [Heliobacterium chlorum]|uniref:Low molecular weight protein arginine phosphatase n=1 Tax=Heliobacterium chlorum TaxID=2698 RepID=A0ABR7T1I0_HELCL|nr:low molecular weight protein arginine phosphatase [Heliobacterium chlorum]MBC9784531.1 low molecular weight protein arginine phosphatase [Heliobacterium chlorum]
MFTLLFVCTGNTCRSPMAQVLAQKGIAQRGLKEQVKVASAGTMAWPGAPASAHAQKVMADRNLDLSEHASRPLDEALIREADLILTMTGSHRDMVLQAAPGNDGKVFSLREFIGTEGDIADPFGRNEQAYACCAGEIEEAIEKALDRIEQSLKRGSQDIV